MAKRIPYSPNKKKPSAEQKKRIAAIKTALPLFITLALLALVYVFVLVPEEPANVLKRAILNSSDTNKYKSIRYDGTFGDTNRGIEAEYAGQNAGNGDREFRIRFIKDESSTSLETVTTATVTYIRLSGVENAKSVLGSITGIKTPDDATISALTEIQNKWVKLDTTASASIDKLLPCSTELFGASENTAPLSEESYPFTYTAGPILPKDDTEDEIYEATIDTSARTQGSFERRLLGSVECLETAYGEDDFRLRQAGSVDVEAAKVTVRIDPLSSTVKRLTIKQVGVYYQLNLRDYNKDVSIVAPDGAVDVLSLYSTLSEPTKTYLASKLSIPSL